MTVARRILAESALVLAVGAAVAVSAGAVAGALGGPLTTLSGGGTDPAAVVLTGSGLPLQAASAPCAVPPGDVASASAPEACPVAAASAPVGARSLPLPVTFPDHFPFPNGTAVAGRSVPVADSSAPVARSSAPVCTAGAGPDGATAAC